MWKKLAVGGAVTAAIVGVGTAAVASSGTLTSGAPVPAASGTAAPANRPHPGKAFERGLGRALHGTWVGRDAAGTGFVTHSAIRGTVTAVSATSITVKAADNFSQTFTVTKDTKVRERTQARGKGTAIDISKIANGDSVAVEGTGTTSNPTAKAVVKLPK
jgi:hypothetical protein